MNIKGAIEHLLPGAKYEDNVVWLWGQFPELSPEDYENNIIWLDERSKPSLLEIGGACLYLLKENRCKEVAKIRDEILAIGVPYMFPNDVPGHIQIRDEKDRTNVMINGMVGLVYVINEQSTAPMRFRDQENRVHNMTAQQMMEMSMYAASYGQHVYDTSWTHKDHIRNYESIENTLEEIQNAYNYILNYDITTGWIPGE